VKTDPTFWLLARASGLTAYVLLTTTALAGLVLKARPFGRAVKAAALTDVHRFLTFLALGALVLHGVALTLDHTVHMSLTALVVLGRFDELALHIRGARRNGLSPEEIAEVLLQTAVYCGVPAANSAFHVFQRVLEEDGG